MALVRQRIHFSALALALALQAGCDASKQDSRNGGGPAHVVSPATRAEDRSAPEKAPAPVSSEPDSLAHCLSPPYVRSLETAEGVRDRPWSVMTCPEDVKSRRADQPLQERRVVLWPSSAGRAADLEVAQKVATLVREKLGGESQVGAGLCCTASPRLCVRVEFPLCASTSAQIEEAFTTAVELQETGPLALGLVIETQGYIGPRCRADDPACGPMPYNDPPAERLAREPDRFALPYDAHLPRRVVTPAPAPRDEAPTPARLTCGHDGDCVPGCLVWRDRRAGQPAAGVLHGALLDAYCGCVEGTCQYFESARPLVKVRFEGEVLDWGEHPSPDPRRYLVGFGDGQQVVAARLERKDMVRHMTRCFLGHEGELPRAIEFSMRIPRHRDARAVDVRLKTATSSEAERCVLSVLKEQKFPPPPSAKDVSVEGTLHLTLSD